LLLLLRVRVISATIALIRQHANLSRLEILSIPLQQLLDYLQNRKKITLSNPIDFTSYGLDRNVNKAALFVDAENQLLVTPVINVEPSTGLAMRGNYYDRNAFSKNESYDVQGIAPHALTVRWTYTVPTGKCLMVQDQFLDLRVDTGGLVATGTIEIDIIAALGGVHTIQLKLIAPAAVSHLHDSLLSGTRICLLEGDRIQCQTSLISLAGNTCDYIGTFSGVVFDK
jgi:hypothetical protein